MAHSALTHVFVGLRTGLHVLVAALTVLVVVRAVFAPSASSVVVIVVAGVLLGTYESPWVWFLGVSVAGGRQAG